ncbi:hypothetical protein FRC03_007070 [Tulasnella sp. 419]|nr:hypothetical protein FRC03_007070 [Tulasnella sp. 419]
MVLSQVQISLSSASGSSSRGLLMPNGTALYLTKQAVVADISGQRPQVITSVNGPLTRTETHGQLDLPRGVRERSVGVASIPEPYMQLKQPPLVTSGHSTHREIPSLPRATRGTKRKAEHLNNEPAQPRRFSPRLREKKERKEMQSKTQEKKADSAQRMKVE